jgi:hypothetical protein
MPMIERTRCAEKSAERTTFAHCHGAWGCALEHVMQRLGESAGSGLAPKCHMRFLDQDDFVAHVAAHLGATSHDVRRICRVVLDSFASWLTPIDRALFADELFGASADADLSVALPVEENLVALGMTLGQAREAIASVGHVLGEHLSDDMLARLQHALPMAVATSTVRPAVGASVTRARARRYDTLADGQPGSHAPICEAHPASNARASTTLTQERDDEGFVDDHGRPIAPTHE